VTAEIAQAINRELRPKNIGFILITFDRVKDVFTYMSNANREFALIKLRQCIEKAEQEKGTDPKPPTLM
jgi:hypothetical protein